MAGPEGNSELVMIGYMTKQRANKFWKTRWNSSDQIRQPSTARSNHVQKGQIFAGNSAVKVSLASAGNRLPAHGIWR